MSLTNSLSFSRLRCVGVSGLVALAGVGAIGAGSASAATAGASSSLYQQAPNTVISAGITAPIQSIDGGNQGSGSGDQSGDGNYQAILAPPPSPPRFL